MRSGSEVWDLDRGSEVGDQNLRSGSGFGIWGLGVRSGIRLGSGSGSGFGLGAGLSVCVPRREDGGWWRSWLQQSYQAVKEKVGTAGIGRDLRGGPGFPRVGLGCICWGSSG